MIFKFPNRKFKSVWWMPRLKEAMKDVAWRRYASGRCLATFDPEISEWGNPRVEETRIFEFNSRTHTWGSETSQYPEEEKTSSFIFHMFQCFGIYEK